MSQHLQNRSKMWLGFERDSLIEDLARIHYSEVAFSRCVWVSTCYCGKEIHGNSYWKKTRNDEVAYFYCIFIYVLVTCLEPDRDVHGLLCTEYIW